MSETHPPTNAYTVTAIPPHILEQAQKDLRSWKISRQKRGVDTLLEYGETGIDTLLKIVAKRYDHERMWGRYITPVQLFIAGALILGASGENKKLMGGIGVLIASIGIQHIGHSALLLAKIEDKRVLPYILTLPYPASQCDHVLKNLLPKLTFEDAYRLPITAQHRTAIHNIIHSQDRALASAALKALEQIGDETSVEPVKWLMKTTPSPLIRERCKECLSYLEQNALKHEQAQTLLRASSAENIATEELLRPIKGGQSEPSEELLRTLSDTNSREA